MKVQPSPGQLGGDWVEEVELAGLLNTETRWA